LRLELQLPKQTAAVVVETAILRSLHPNHARLEFLQFAPGDKQRLQQFVRELISPTSQVQSPSQ
jgi:ABC-type antimicrobial peptide transport system ATPase subunit